MTDYQIFKVKGTILELMGTYSGETPQDAVNAMGERGNLRGGEWISQYYAIPYGDHFKKLTPEAK